MSISVRFGVKTGMTESDGSHSPSNDDIFVIRECLSPQRHQHLHMWNTSSSNKESKLLPVTEKAIAASTGTYSDELCIKGHPF